MKPERFDSNKTGDLVPIQTPTGRDFGFIPNKLPPNWSFPQSLVSKLIAARSALAKLDGIGRTIPEPELLMTPLKRREAITSSRIEGTYATAQELMLFEMSQPEPKSSHDPVNSWREVLNYSTALTKGTQLLNELPFCGRLIKELHCTLMTGVRGQQSTPGAWRDHQVAIGSDRRFVPPPVPQMIEAMNDLEKYVNEPSEFDPLVRAFLVHYQFEAIHPFADGNGRIGRVLLSLMISKDCELSAPWLYLSAFFERYKDEYISNLFSISANGNWTKWIDFCLTGTIQQANDAIRRCEKLGKLKDNMFQRMRQNCSPRTERIIHDLFKEPLVTVAHLAKKLEVSYPTALADVNRLVKAGILTPLDTPRRPRAYGAMEISEIAYSEIDY